MNEILFKLFISSTKGWEFIHFGFILVRIFYQSNRRTDLRGAWKGLRFIRVSFDNVYTIWRCYCKCLWRKWRTDM